MWEFMIILLSIVNSAVGVCTDPQPLIDSVLDDNFSASLDSDDDHPPSDAKLSSGDAWCSVEISDVNTAPFIQVDFDSAVEINSVSVGGHTDVVIPLVFEYDEYIVNYNIVYRPPGGEEQFVTNGDGNPMVFAREGNVDVQTVVLNASIITDILQIRALPGSWISENNRLCIRFEASGCLAILPNTTSVTSSLYLSTSITTHSISSSVMQSLPIGTMTTTFNENSLYNSKSSSYSSSVDASSHSNSDSSSTITESNRPVVNSSSGKGNEAAIYGSSAAAGVFIIVAIIVIIVFLMFIALRKSRKKESSCELDNRLYA